MYVLPDTTKLHVTSQWLLHAGDQRIHVHVILEESDAVKKFESHTVYTHIYPFILDLRMSGDLEITHIINLHEWA